MVDAELSERSDIQAILDGGLKLTKAEMELDAHEHNKKMTEKQMEQSPKSAAQQ